MSIAQPHSDAFVRFYTIALEYYVTGRASLLCGNTLITGNLLHHAVEMLLKGQLSKTTPIGDLKKLFGHKLPKLWAAFKALIPAENLAEFDGMIDELDRFEAIRYPDEILARGASVSFGFGRGRPVTKIESEGNEPEYQIGIGDVDAFFSRLIPLCKLNPKAYFGFLSSSGRELLTEENAQSEGWLP
jgi:hypothetical protein